MKLKVISTSSSKKGKKYLSVEIIEGEFPATGEILRAQEVNEKNPDEAVTPIKEE